MLVVTDEEVSAAALSLNCKERAELAHKLIVSLDEEGEEPSGAEWEAAWVAEAERRLQDLREGKTTEILAAQVFACDRAEAQVPPVPPPDATPGQRILWTPTPGQDLTKTLFPLAPTPAKP
jgi:putative addiction module component (TIGR02574 family)